MGFCRSNFKESDCRLVCSPDEYIYNQEIDDLNYELFCECLYNNTSKIICDRTFVNPGFIFLFIFGGLIALAVVSMLFTYIYIKIKSMIKFMKKSMTKSMTKSMIKSTIIVKETPEPKKIVLISYI